MNQVIELIKDGLVDTRKMTGHLKWYAKSHPAVSTDSSVWVCVLE